MLAMGFGSKTKTGPGKFEGKGPMEFLPVTKGSPGSHNDEHPNTSCGKTGGDLARLDLRFQATEVNLSDECSLPAIDSKVPESEPPLLSPVEKTADSELLPVTK